MCIRFETIKKYAQSSNIFKPMNWAFFKYHFESFPCLTKNFIYSLSEHRNFRLCFDVARNWEKSLHKFFLYILPTSEALIWKWFESFFSLFCQWKRKQAHINIFNITWLKAHCSHQFIKCRQMWIWILMIHCCKLIGIDESDKSGFYFQGLGGSRYCNTRKMSWPLVHDIISEYPPRRWCLLVCHVTFLLKNVVSGKRKVVKDSSLVSSCLSFCLCFLVSFGYPVNLCFK